MTGTLVNAAAIAAGGCVGLLLKKGVKGSHQDSINKALGVAVLVLGLNGVISSMFTVNADGTLASSSCCSSSAWCWARWRARRCASTTG